MIEGCADFTAPSLPVRFDQAAGSPKQRAVLIEEPPSNRGGISSIVP